MKEGGLGRNEWLAALAVMAVRKYVDCGREKDASAALGRLIREVFLARGQQLAPEVFEDVSHFRWSRLYTEEVCNVFTPKVSSLRVIFAAFASLSGGISERSDLMNANEYMAFCEDMLPGRGTKVPYESYTSARELRQIFLRSRMLVIDEYGAKKVLGRQLQFEDWCEALGRLAALVPLPGKAEIREAGVSVFAFVRELEGRGSTLWEEYLQGWRRTLDPWPQRVETFLGYLIDRIETVAKGGVDNGTVTEREVRQFLDSEGRATGGLRPT